ncbi:uncharacterized protein LOC144749703 [Ciona intestinalis]
MASAQSKLSDMKAQAKQLIRKPAAIIRQDWSAVTESVAAVVPEQLPLPTPESPTDIACEMFKSNVWWMKDNKDMWHPCDKHVISKISNFEFKQDRVFGFWVNLVTTETKNCTFKWKQGDARIAYFDVVNDLDTVIGPPDHHWKMPLWLRAQRFRILCYDNPCCMDEPLICSEQWLEDELTFKLQHSSKNATPVSGSPKRRNRFLVVTCEKPFLPKPVYSKNPNS